VKLCGGREIDEVVAHVELAPGASGAWARVPGVVGAVPLFSRSPAALAIDRLVASVHSGRPMPDLGRWRRVRLRGTHGEIERALARLAASPDVVEAFVPPVAELATIARLPDDGPSCPINTPRYDERQKYLGPAPAGIDAPFAWQRPGGRGQAVQFADVEG